MSWKQNFEKKRPETAENETTMRKMTIIDLFAEFLGFFVRLLIDERIGAVLQQILNVLLGQLLSVA
jgi:hypothetical protein